MKITVKRQECGRKSTLGRLLVDGVDFCFCIEDQDRQLEVNPDAKIMHETCIPRGTYNVIITWSNRFNKELPLLVGVPNFEGVRIHPGNTNSDTSGCILPATSYGRDSSGNAIGVNSREAFRKLFLKIESAIDLGKEVTIEVT
jgi:hypothetical protein